MRAHFEKSRRRISWTTDEHETDLLVTEYRLGSVLNNNNNKKCELTQSAGPQCIAPGFPVEDEKILMPGMILSDGEEIITR